MKTLPPVLRNDRARGTRGGLSENLRSSENLTRSQEAPGEQTRSAIVNAGKRRRFTTAVAQAKAKKNVLELIANEGRMGSYGREIEMVCVDC